MMANNASLERETFLSDVADKLEAAADNLGTESGHSNMFCESKSSNYCNAGFASKLVYTACYSLSYGVCFPAFVVCHYIPKNNRFVEGLTDGQAAANQSVDNMLERAKANRLARKQAREQKRELDDVIESGVGCLEPA